MPSRAETRTDIALLKARLSLSALVQTFIHFDKARSRPARGEYWACCPFHGEKTPSFKVDDGRGQYHCFGCGASGDHITFIREYSKVDFRTAKAQLEDLVGAAPQSARPPKHTRANAEADRKATQARAFEIYKAASATARDQVLAYLAARGLDVPRLMPHLAGLRQGVVWHSREVGRLPAMVAPLQDRDGHFSGVHVTFLDPQGAPRKAPIAKAKKMFGRAGGASIRFGVPARNMILAEGIETGLSVLQVATKVVVPAPTLWVAASLGNMAGPAASSLQPTVPDMRRPAILLPAVCQLVLIAADNDAKDPKFTEECMARARARHGTETREVRVMMPPASTDWNDVLQGAGD